MSKSAPPPAICVKQTGRIGSYWIYHRPPDWAMTGHPKKPPDRRCCGQVQ